MKLTPAILLLPCLVSAQMHDMPGMAGKEPPVSLKPGLGAVHHRVTTSSPLAQKFFDQGLALYYGFNMHEAERCFAHAAELDPKMAMAYWGVALSLGPNINSGMDADREKRAYAAIAKAQDIEGPPARLSALCVNSATNPKSYSSEPSEERALIGALATRYEGSANADYGKLDQAYRNAMRDVAKAYPQDDDVGTLYAESIMDLNPWRLWSPGGQPTPGTPEIVAVLERVLARDPNHIGANHFYIHAVEASKHPEDAMESAKRLGHLAPNAGHLVHMPSHIYIRTGFYHDAVLCNEKGIVADEPYLGTGGQPGGYHFMHNYSMLLYAASMEGNYRECEWVCDLMSKRFGSMGSDDLARAMIRFRKWKEILDPAMKVSSHFAKCLAYCGSGDVASATKEREAYSKESGVPISALTGGDGARINMLLMDAAVTEKSGDAEKAIECLQEAVKIQDAMPYGEPPDYFFPVRESLGGALLRAGKASEAQSVFEEDLRLNPKNPRSLFGLWRTLSAQGKPSSEEQRDFRNAWKYSDASLAVPDL